MTAQQVERAAELHDIGKIAVPDAILHKSGTLDDNERRFMREYPIVGERILRAAPSLAPVAPLVRSSHERWDGRGYPDGLRRESPIGARIIAACDAYHAMRSAHLYRPARTNEEAVAELRRCAGTQFDPTVVQALCAELGDPASAGELLAIQGQQHAPHIRVAHANRRVDIPSERCAARTTARLVLRSVGPVRRVVRLLGLPRDQAILDIHLPRARARAVHAMSSAYDLVVLPAIAVALLPLARAALVSAPAATVAFRVSQEAKPIESPGGLGLRAHRHRITPRATRRIRT